MTDVNDPTERMRPLTTQTVSPKGHSPAAVATKVRKYGTIINMSATASDIIESLVLLSRLDMRQATRMVKIPLTATAITSSSMRMHTIAATSGVILCIRSASAGDEVLCRTISLTVFH